MIDDKINLAEVKRQEEMGEGGDTPRAIEDTQTSEPTDYLDTGETQETGSSHS